MPKKPSGLVLLLSDQLGVYIPSKFVSNFDLTKWNDISAYDIAKLSGPLDADDYWDSWVTVLDNAWLRDDHGNKFRLYQDGDLWAICYELMTVNEKDNFFGKNNW